MDFSHPYRRGECDAGHRCLVFRVAAASPDLFLLLDGLVAIWGLGIVVAYVAFREDRNLLKATGGKGMLSKAAVTLVMAVILALPSVFSAL